MDKVKDMDNLKGQWRSKKDLALRVNLTAFTFHEGNLVTVEQVDKERGKVLIRFQYTGVDWFGKRFLDNFEKV